MIGLLFDSHLIAIMPAVLSKFLKAPIKKVPTSKKELSCLSPKDGALFKENVCGTYSRDFDLRKVDGHQMLLGERADRFGDSSVLSGWTFAGDTRETRRKDEIIRYGKSLFEN